MKKTNVSKQKTKISGFPIFCLGVFLLVLVVVCFGFGFFFLNTIQEEAKSEGCVRAVYIPSQLFKQAVGIHECQEMHIIMPE